MYIYGRGQEPHKVHTKYAGPNKLNRYFYLRVGRVEEVDTDLYRIKVSWLDGPPGQNEWFPMFFSVAGPSSCMGGVPERYSIVICGYVDDGTDKGKPMGLAYLPASLQQALDHTTIKINPDSLVPETDNIQYLKFRNIKQGDLIMASSLGGELLINSDVELQDGMRDKILIRKVDQSIIMTSLNNFQFSDGIAISSGQIFRNNAPIFDANGNRITGTLAREVVYPTGREAVQLVPFGQPLTEITQFLTEYRVDASDIADGILDTNSINSSTVLSNQDPLVSMIMGNYAGNSHDSRYARMLRPVLFSSARDSEGLFSLAECTQFNGYDQVRLIGVAWAVHLLKNDAFMGFDKEGSFYLNMNSTSAANPTGAGRSMSLLGNGNLKEIWGPDANDGNSWDLTAKGGVRWLVGAHTGKFRSRSFDAKFSSGVKIVVSGNDDDKYARQELIYGNTLENIGGTETKQVNANSNLVITGLKKETIYGSASYEYHVDKTESCLGVYTQIVSKEMQGRFGKRKETVTLGQTLEIMTGDDVETIKTFGNKKTSLTLGNIEETLIAGDRKISITAGKFTVTIVAGNIKIETLGGTMKLVSLSGTTIQSQTKVEVKATKVELGWGPTGGVVTGLPGLNSHYDYVTGAPLKGCATVKAGM